MKKPPYLEVRFPRAKGTLRPILKGYFKRLEGKVLGVDFGRYRGRKIFQYKVISVGFDRWEYAPTYRKIEEVRLRLEQVEATNEG